MGFRGRALAWDACGIGFEPGIQIVNFRSSIFATINTYFILYEFYIFIFYMKIK